MATFCFVLFYISSEVSMLFLYEHKFNKQYL